MPQEDGFVNRQGYWWTSDGSHPRSNHGYLKRSVLVLEEKLGRPLKPEEMVHHIDGNRGNDDPANLETTTRSLHMSQHSPINDRWEINRKQRKERKQKAIELWNAGYNMMEITEYLKTNHTRVADYLEEIRGHPKTRRKRLGKPIP